MNLRFTVPTTPAAAGLSSNTTFLLLPGLTPSEHSSAGKQRLEHISKQGSPFLRGLLVEAAQSAARHDAELKRYYLRLAWKRRKSIAKVAVARKLLVKLYWMLRTGAHGARFPGSSCR